MVLTQADMGAGWMAGSAGSPGKAQIFSSAHVTFTKGSAFSPAVQNTVEVYRTLAAAQTAYQDELPANTAAGGITNPGLGDESFLNNSVPANKELVFRKANVVAYIWVQNDKTDDPIQFAQTVLQKITP